MTPRPATSPKHWLPRALAVLALIIASCSVPKFEIGVDQGPIPSHCTNLISDEGESGLDCGGTCPACPAGGSCLVNTDCLGNACTNGVCQNLACTDGVLSGTESDVDCGGGACAPCASGQACGAARDCTSGVCNGGVCAEPSCSDGVTNGEETDIDCGGACSSCTPGQKCKLPADCAGGDCVDGACSLMCVEGKGDCDGNPANGCETNLKTDAAHCAACDTPCNLAHASSTCKGGSCAVLECTPPFEDCDGDPSNGCEVNLSTDVGNCSKCGKGCPSVNGKAACVASACQIECTAGFADCDDDRVNGCERRIDSDPNNCGKCGKTCSSANGTPRCKAGVCGVSDCPTGFEDCDNDPKNGCETDLNSDVKNCSVCNLPCVTANGTPSCVAGSCKVGSCDPTYSDCNLQAADGCEANLQSDVANCGVCNQACTIGNAKAKCENKSCKVASCTAPWDDCDGNGTDCETNTHTSLTNCGACGTTCIATHGSNSCSGGSCVPSCSAGFADCDGNPRNGCETAITSDLAHCGACGTVCQQTNASNVCQNGACSPICSQSYFKSCDGNNNNGCEADTRTSKANCGACGSPCLDNQTSSNNCVGGACAPVCLANHANCDGNPNNGCELPTGSDPLNCGGCGVQCKTQNASATTCSGGACNPTCNDGYAACTNAAAGCLTSIDTVAHCGNCNTSCSGATPFCVARACAAHLDIGVVNANTKAITTATGQTLSVPHTLQTSAAANAYRLVVVGVTGFGNGTASLPTSVQYNNIDMTLAKVSGPTNQVASAIYYMQGSKLPANAGTYTVLIGSAGANTFVLTANVLELTNVEQATGAIDAVGGQGNPNSCAVHQPSDAVNVSTVGDLLYSVAGVYGSAADASPNLTGQTISEQVTQGNLGTVAGYIKAPVTGARTLTWALTSCMASAHALISIKPALTP